uniref:F-box domain-containing protein n=1 Tax=Meloidogyne incognita TaxID=6306 RepID=A0A914L3Z7_MELIC
MNEISFQKGLIQSNLSLKLERKNFIPPELLEEIVKFCCLNSMMHTSLFSTRVSLAFNLLVWKIRVGCLFQESKVHLNRFDTYLHQLEDKGCLTEVNKVIHSFWDALVPLSLQVDRARFLIVFDRVNAIVSVHTMDSLINRARLMIQIIQQWIDHLIGLNLNFTQIDRFLLYRLNGSIKAAVSNTKIYDWCYLGVF